MYFRDLFVRMRGWGYQMIFEAFVSAQMADGVEDSSSSVGSDSSTSSSSNGSLQEGVTLKLPTSFEVRYYIQKVV